MENKRRLIASDEALRMVENSKTDNPYIGTLADGVWKIAHDCAISCVEACPTVDAVEVVRCKECIFSCYNSSNESWSCTTYNGMHRRVQAEEFCSYGEKRC